MLKAHFNCLNFIIILIDFNAFKAVCTFTVFANPGYIRSQQVQSMWAWFGVLLEIFMTVSKVLFRSA